jgi:hypothetical protein
VRGVFADGFHFALADGSRDDRLAANPVRNDMKLRDAALRMDAGPGEISTASVIGLFHTL